MKRSTIIAVAVVLTLLATALLCADKFPEYPTRAARECASSAGAPGVTVGAQPLTAVDEQRLYFRENLASKGAIPVYLVIENQSKQEPLLFEKSGIACGSQESGPAGTPNVTNSKGREVVGGAVWSLSMTHYYENQQNLQKREIRSTTIAPGASIHGFIYLEASKIGAGGNCKLRVPFKKANTGEGVAVEISL